MDIKNILIADDHSLVRDGLRNLLSELSNDLNIVECVNCQQTIDAVEARQDLDLILFDLRMPDLDGFKVLERLANNMNAVPVVVVSASEDIGSMQRALDIGAMGYIPKSESNEVMLSAIRLVLSGGVYMPSKITHFRPTDSQQAVQQKSSAFSSLTSRQYEVLCLIMEGRSNRDIADVLELSEVTVKTHVSAVLKNLGVNSRTQAVLQANKLGFPGGFSSGILLD